MYADIVEAAAKRSVKERLNGHVVDDSIRRRPVTGKRQRQDDKWEHDLFDGSDPQVSSSTARKLDSRDLRLKLQRKTTSQQTALSGGVRDLRDMLSGSMHPQPSNNVASKPKIEAVPNRPTRKSVIEPAAAESKRVADLKKTRQKGELTVEGFLRSLGLEKYQIQFQAEEIDMTALEHMTDEDFKVMGIPMGPRKKIQLALSLRS